MNKSPLKFFLLVFGLSIPFWIIDFTMETKRTSLMNFSITDIITAFIPLTVAFILVYKEEGRSGVNQLFKRVFDFARITKKNMVFANNFSAIIYIFFNLHGHFNFRITPCS